jgi:hypothetical protein
MKKILSIFTGLFIALSMFVTSNTVYALTEVNLWDSDIWINFWNSCLTWMGKGCFHYEKIIWIDKEQPDYTATSVVQDIIFAATYIVWTILTIIMIYCWLWYIFNASSSSDKTGKYTDWLKNALIWSILVRWSYAIVRLIQYIAQW